MLKMKHIKLLCTIAKLELLFFYNVCTSVKYKINYTSFLIDAMRACLALSVPV